MRDYQKAEANSLLLGQDFLTWLWCVSEVQNGSFQAKSGEDFFLYVEQKVAVTGGEGESLDRTVVSGKMSELAEARAGLTRGKKVSLAQIRIEQDTNVWQLQLKAEDFTCTGLKTPKVVTKIEEGEDPDGPFLEKMFLLEKCLQFIDEIFARFLTLRFGGEWDEQAAKVKNWIHSE